MERKRKMRVEITKKEGQKNQEEDKKERKKEKNKQGKKIRFKGDLKNKKRSS